MIRSRLLAGLVVALSASTAPLASQEGLKVFISADMEGVVGVVTGDQLGPGGFEYDRFRQFMTAEVLAAIQGARAAGRVNEIVSEETVPWRKRNIGLE